MSALIQNTPEWLEIRKGKIGASDASIIMGASPYKTPFQLWEEKLGLAPPPEQNAAMRRGHELEEPARKRMEELTGMMFVPSVKFHPKIDWMMCSLDCLSLDENTIGEIKTVGKEDHEKALAGIVPEKHIPQLQHQMEVCEKDSTLYFSFYKDDGIIVKILRDEPYIKEMLKEEERFYECLQNLEPPKLSSRDYHTIDTAEWLNSVSTWKEVNEKLKDIKEQEKKVRASIIGMCHNQRSKGGGVQVLKIVEKGRIDYSLIPELKNVNLNVYRKPSIEKWKITKEKSNG